MKKTMIFILIVIFISMSACSVDSTNISKPEMPDETSNVEETEESATSEKTPTELKVDGNIIEEGKDYILTSLESENEEIYKLYVKAIDGQVLEESYYQKPLLKYITDNLLEIGAPAGTGVINYRYYSLSENKFSEYFEIPSLVENGVIVYMSGAVSDIKLIVQDIFDKDKLYKEFKRDFWQVSTPSMTLIDVKFLSEDEIQVIYFSGEDQVEQTEIISLK